MNSQYPILYSVIVLSNRNVKPAKYVIFKFSGTLIYVQGDG